MAEITTQGQDRVAAVVATLHGWHFLRADRRLGYADGRVVRVGETLTVDGDVVLCQRGLHASPTARDALRYAPGWIVCRVRLEGVVQRDDDKAVGTARTVLAMADARETILDWACWCAEGALLGQVWTGRPVDARSVAAVIAVREYLAGRITRRQLRAAAYDAAAVYTADAVAYADAAAYAVAYAAYADAYDADAVAYAAYADAAAYAVAARPAANARTLLNAELERRLHALLGTEGTDA